MFVYRDCVHDFMQLLAMGVAETPKLNNWEGCPHIKYSYHHVTEMVGMIVETLNIRHLVVTKIP